MRRSWPNCRTQKSGKTFRASTALKKHPETHLVKILWCTHASCQHNQPFSRQSDLDRYVRTEHSRRQNLCCLVTLCSYHDIGFARKEKLIEHTRKRYSLFRCPLDHCNAQVLEIDREIHLHDDHGINNNSCLVHECSLTRCVSSKTRFTYEAAKEHLRINYGMRHSAIVMIIVKDEVKTSNSCAFLRYE